MGTNLLVAALIVKRHDLSSHTLQAFVQPWFQRSSRYGLKASSLDGLPCHCPWNRSSGVAASARSLTVRAVMRSWRPIALRLSPVADSSWTVAWFTRVRSAKRWPLGQGEPEGSSSFFGSGARWAGPGARTCGHPRWSATHRSAAALRLRQRCHLSATCTACGAPSRGTLGIERCPVPADHLRLGPFREPSGQAGRLPVGQQVHRTPTFDIDQDRPVVTPFTSHVLIDADHPRGRNFGVRQRFDQPQHRTAADRRTEHTRQAGTSPTSEREADRGQRRPHALGPPNVPTGQSRQLLSEGQAPARDDRAEETTDPHVDEATRTARRSVLLIGPSVTFSRIRSPS